MSETPYLPCDLLLTYVGPDPLGGIEVHVTYCDPTTRTSLGHTTFRLDLGDTLELCNHLALTTKRAVPSRTRQRTCPEP
jgi:hypothetical protein